MLITDHSMQYKLMDFSIIYIGGRISGFEDTWDC